MSVTDQGNRVIQKGSVMANKETEDAKTEETEGVKTEETEEPKTKGERKKHVEDRLDDVADKFSKVMAEGVRRMEDAFDKGMKKIKDNPSIEGGNVKDFFFSSTGGGVLVVFGVIWFLYAIGLFDHWLFPLLVIALGLYLMYRHKPNE
jgi:hypothetical protein